MTDDAVDAHKMPLLDHLVELRSRLLKSVVALVLAFLVCFFFAEPIYAFLTEPLAEILRERRENPRMIFTALTEVFFTYVKVAFFAGAFLTCPVFLTQFWLFVAPGLYKKERKALAPFLFATPVLFFIGGALVYYVIFPLAASFLIGFEVPSGEGAMAIELEAKVGEYLSLIMKLIFAFGSDSHRFFRCAASARSCSAFRSKTDRSPSSRNTCPNSVQSNSSSGRVSSL